MKLPVRGPSARGHRRHAGVKSRVASRRCGSGLSRHRLKTRTGSSTALPSLDIIIEGDARKVTDEATLRRATEAYGSKLEWRLEIRGDTVHGPNAPSAEPPPYSAFRLIRSLVFGLPGTLGMERFDPADLPRPTRWEFQIEVDRPRNANVWRPEH
jgi:hypothetical protein